LASAAQGEPGAVGFAHYYLCETADWPSGARVLARLPTMDEGRRGVRVPASALVWHEGKPWIYLQRTEDRFERHPAVAAEAIGADDWFVADLPAGAPVVTSGAPLLLSEEMRHQIKNENED
jgi:hypothetical protein